MSELLAKNGPECSLIPVPNREEMITISTQFLDLFLGILPHTNILASFCFRSFLDLHIGLYLGLGFFLTCWLAENKLLIIPTAFPRMKLYMHCCPSRANLILANWDLGP